ncbi:chitobiase/beta-hexosaminidase C-terminal domain-containing protein [Flavobacteriaceae bacterium]|nr:chitobiase/beta-hexosaminidase C-terminal domain-containing protein [Flavobacteriaceae bacterium]
MEILNYLGKFHPVVLHLPIGALYLTFCLVLLEKFFKSNYTIPIRFGLLFSFVFSVLSAMLGYFLYLGDDFSGDLIERHMRLGISTTLFIGLLLWIHKTTTHIKYFNGVFLITIVLLSVTGHFGGQITHGSEYLKLPDFSKTSNQASVDSLNLYTSIVMPILDNKCVKCHNQNKSKGDLILNSKESILKGGESGSILVTFDPESSHLYNYPNLPMEDEMHMPPEGNSQLTENEIELLRIWIDKGAEFESFNSFVSFEKSEQEIVNSFIKVDLEKVDPPRKKDLEKLLELNFRLERNSVSNNYLEAKFLGTVLKSKHLNALSKVKTQLIKLDLSNSNLNDNLIYDLKSFENLKYLKINNTSITDNGLLSVSPSVESLNLNNTDISFEGLKQLLQNNELKNVYLWNTNLNNENQQMLTDLYSANLNFGVSDFAKGVPLSSPEPISEQTMFSDSIKIEFYKPLGDPTIRYTINGEDPDSLSTIYKNPFFISNSANLKAKAFKSGWLDSKIGSVDFVKVEGILKDYILKTAPDNRYKNPKKLFDGIVGDINFRDGDWNGFIRTQDYKAGVNERNSGDLVLEIDLKGKSHTGIGIHALESIGSYIMFPKRIELYDIGGKNDKLIYSKDYVPSILGASDLVKFFKIPIAKESNKLRLVVKSNKKLPKGHPAQGEFAWLFVDEILFL